MRYPSHEFPGDSAATATRKEALRREVLARRRAQGDKEALSSIICDRLSELAEYQAARCIILYAGAKSEVRTLPAISRALKGGKTVGLPFCRGRELEVCRIAAIDELAPRAYNIPEPTDSVRALAERSILPGEINLIVIPGVAFDRRGARLGHGEGYYDRLLSRLPATVCRVGLAFDCQIVAELPTSAHDQFVHAIVTEDNVYKRNAQ